MVVYIQVYSFLHSCFDDSFCLSIWKVKVYSDMTDDKDEGIRKLTFCLSYFHSSLQDHHPKYQENHMQRESHLVLQEIDYKKANATNNGLFYSQVKMLVMHLCKNLFHKLSITTVLLCYLLPYLLDTDTYCIVIDLSIDPLKLSLI